MESMLTRGIQAGQAAFQGHDVVRLLERDHTTDMIGGVSSDHDDGLVVDGVHSGSQCQQQYGDERLHDRWIGVITFEETDDIVTLKGSLSGLYPSGEHGFHVHEFGDCSAPDFTSAGPHYNPRGKEHAGPGDADRHAGDLGNISADSMGNSTIEKTDDMIRIKPSSGRSVIGRAVIVHERPDDLGKGSDEESKKTGNAGKRLACGVIGIAKIA